MTFQDILGSNDLGFQFLLIGGAAIEVSMGVAAKLAPPEIPIADLVPCQGEESPSPFHQVVLEFLVIFNRLRCKKQRDRDSYLLGHRSQTHKIVSIAIIEGKRDTRDLHFTRTQEFHAFG